MIKTTSQRTSQDVSASPVLSLDLCPGAFWIGVACQVIFGLLVLANSVLLLVRYITLDFFGLFNIPFFGWVHTFMFASSVLYFPFFAASLWFIVNGPSQNRSRRLAIFFILLQVATGISLLFLPITVQSGWTILFGPNINKFINLTSGYYADSLVSLLPLAWMALIQWTAAIPAASYTPRQGPSYGPFLQASLCVSLLYALNALLHHWPEPGVVRIAVLSVTAHWILFTAVFLILQFIGRICARFPDPGVFEFISWVLVIWLFSAFSLRWVVLSSLAFNYSLANWYAIILCFVWVTWGAGLLLRIRQFISSTRTHHIAPSFLRASFPWTGLLLAAAAACVFYLGMIRWAALDWNQTGAALTALLTWGLFLLLFFSVSKKPFRDYGAALLTVLALCDGVSFVAVRATALQADGSAHFGGVVDQYSTYDPSFGSIQRLLETGIHDDSYKDFYEFLNQHANIRARVAAPDVQLAGSLTPAKGIEPNIFVFVIDALRRDYLSPYNPKVTFTPSIQTFSEDSVVFQDAYTPFAGSTLAESTLWAGLRLLHKTYPDPLPRMNALKKMLDADHYECYVSYDSVLQALLPKSGNITVLQNDTVAWMPKEFGAVIRELEADLLKRKPSDGPVFAYSQPSNVHTLTLAVYGRQVKAISHPGFNDLYATALENVDRALGNFVQFLKAHGYYQNSIIVLTADHGESLGDWGRFGHHYIDPEVMRIPMIIHLPRRMQDGMTWDAYQPAFLQDLTPTLYYLLGHRPIKKGPPYGRPLFSELQDPSYDPPDHYLLMSSYLPVFGILSGDEKSLFVVDAAHQRNYFYDLEHDPTASRNVITAAVRSQNEQWIRKELKSLDVFYHLTPGDFGLSPSPVRLRSLVHPSATPRPPETP